MDNYSICDKQFISARKLKHHKERHEIQEEENEPMEEIKGKEIEMKICDICNKQFKSNKKLKRHKDNHILQEEENEALNAVKLEANKMKTCKICNKQFKSDRKLKRHKETHILQEEENEAFNALKLEVVEMETCDICGAHLKSAKKLKRHKETHQLLGKDTELDITSKSKEIFKEICGVFEEHSKSATQLHQERQIVKNEVAETTQNPKEKEVAMETCDICDKQFKSLRKLRRHKETHNLAEIKPIYETKVEETEIYTCEICDQNFKSARKLRHHKVSHDENEQIKAPLLVEEIFMEICDIYEDHSKSMEKQQMKDNCLQEEVSETMNAPNIAPIEMEKCDICGFQFKSARRLKRHKEMHKLQELESEIDMTPKSKEMFNEICGVFAEHSKSAEKLNWTKLADFQPLNRPSKDYSCYMCDETFKMKKDRDHHGLTHTSQTVKWKPVKCDLCDMTFRIVGALREHRINIHTKDFKRECSTCGKGFLYQVHLDRHMLTHTGARPHKCEECGKSFSNDGTLINHMKSHKEPTFACHLCDIAFNRKSYLKSHLQLHDKKGADYMPVRCDHCRKIFHNDIKLIAHEMRCTRKGNPLLI